MTATDVAQSTTVAPGRRAVPAQARVVAGRLLLGEVLGGVEVSVLE